MNLDHSQNLSAEHASLGESFAALGDRLLHSARELMAPGAPPPDLLLDDLSAGRRAFEDLRDRILQSAKMLGISCPGTEDLRGLADLSPLIEALSHVEELRAVSERQRREALAVLERVLSIVYRGDDNFAPLQSCQKQAIELHGALSRATSESLPPEAASLVQGEHPLAGLLTLVERRDELEDEVWAALHDTISTNFGKALAAAAARARLDVQPGAFDRREDGPSENQSGVTIRFGYPAIVRGRSSGWS